MINTVRFEGENMYVQFDGTVVSHLGHGFLRISDETGFVGTYTANNGNKLDAFEIGTPVTVTVGNFPALKGSRNTFVSVDITTR